VVQENGPGSRRRSVVVIVIVVIVVGAVAALGYYTFEPGTCSGYPPGGNCVVPYSYSFTISVNYAGPWRLTYTGQTNAGESNPTNVTGTRTGTGNISASVTLGGLNNRMLTLCARAEKLDASNSTPFLSIFYPKNTSTPFGSVSTCGTVAP
jgi:hypothetical protein